jgi:hypothetical protein
MMQKLFLILALLVLLQNVSSFRSIIQKRAVLNSIRVLPNDVMSSLILAVETKPDGYVYGAVNAPGWVLPVGALVAVLTAAVPILLRPGEKVHF